MKIGEIKISTPEEKNLIMWFAENTENKEYKKVVTLTVGNGCEALLILSDGTHVHYSSGMYKIGWAEHAKRGKTIKKIIGVVPLFKMAYALPENGLARYRDKEVDLYPKVNITCDFLCSITNSYKLYLANNCPDELWVRTVRDNIIAQFSRFITENLSTTIADYRYHEMTQAVVELSKNISNAVSPKLLECGISLQDLNCHLHFIPTSEEYDDYDEERKVALEGKKKEARQEQELRTVMSMQKQCDKTSEQTTVKCSRCGKLNSANDRFCKQCGNNLK